MNEELTCRTRYEDIQSTNQSASEAKALTGRCRVRNEDASQLHRGDSMKDLIVYKFADVYRDQVNYCLSRILLSNLTELRMIGSI